MTEDLNELRKMFDDMGKTRLRLRIIEVINKFINEMRGIEQEYYYRWALLKHKDLRQVQLDFELYGDWLEMFHTLRSVATDKLIKARIDYCFGELSLNSDDSLSSMLGDLARLERRIGALELTDVFESEVWRQIPGVENLSVDKQSYETRKLLDRIEPDLLAYYSMDDAKIKYDSGTVLETMSFKELMEMNFDPTDNT